MRIKKNPYTWSLISESLRQNRWRIAMLIMLCLFTAFLPAISPLLFSSIIDDLIPSDKIGHIYIYVLLLILLPIMASVLSNFRNILSYRMSDVMTGALRRGLFDKILHLTTAEIDRFGTSTLSYRMTRSCGQVGEVFLNETLLSLINSGLTLIMVLIPMFWLDRHLALASLAAFPIVYLLLMRTKRCVEERDGKLFDALGNGDAIIRESLDGVRQTKLFGGEERQKNRLNRWLKDYSAAKLSSVKVHEFEHATLPELCLQMLYGMLFVYGAVLVIRDSISLGTLVAFVAYMPRAFGSIKELLGIQVNLRSAEPAIRSIEEVLAAQEEEQGCLPFPAARGEIVFDKVGFCYGADKKFCLSDISFTVHPGEALAIVGETGGGKSTLLHLLLRLYRPTEGTVTLDGKDIALYDLCDYRRQYAFVSQSHFLWSDTVEQNVIWPEAYANAKVFSAAIEKAELRGFLESLPEGKETILGEKGQAVSGGERQRLALVHAFYADRNILLLDEPTSALDAYTEAKITEAITGLKGKKTIISVTHRLSTILSFDKVFVIKNGHIVESGSPAKLLTEKGSQLRAMCMEQGLIV